MSFVTRWLLLLAAWGVVCDDVFSNAELRDAVAELRQLIAGQEEVIADQESHFSRLEQRKAKMIDAKAPARRKLQDAVSDAVFRKQVDGMVDELATALDHMWVILCGALVMFMQAGFAMVEAGCCRAKNVQNILMKNLADACIGTLGWWSMGWAIAYGQGSSKSVLPEHAVGYFGAGFMQENEYGGLRPANGNLQLNWFFQWAFCSAAATVVSGGVAERVKFGGYVMYSLAMSGFIYPVVVSWTWGSGWLSSEVNDVNFIDFAGGGVVHVAGGTGAIVGAVIAGSRHGRWDYPEDFIPHSMPLVVIGTFILWFGWYGFNCGSTLSMHDRKTGMLAAQIAMNTTLSAAVGGLTVFVLRLGILRKYDVGALCNGVLAGLVSITAACGNVESGSAIVIGAIGACLYTAASALLKKLHIDDPIDAFPVHGVCGAWGLMAASFFDWGGPADHVHGWSGWDCMRDPETLECFTGKHGQLIAANAVMLGAIVAWVGVLTGVLFVLLRLVGFLTASDDTQDQGMDSNNVVSSAYTIDESPRDAKPKLKRSDTPVPTDMAAADE